MYKNVLSALTLVLVATSIGCTKPNDERSPRSGQTTLASPTPEATSTPMPPIGNPIRPPAGLGLLVPVGGVCKLERIVYQDFQESAKNYRNAIIARRFDDAIKKLEEVIPALERTVSEHDPYCVDALLFLIDAYDSEFRAYILSSANGSGAIVPISRCHTRYALDAIGRFEKIAKIDDSHRDAVIVARERFQSFLNIQKEVAPNC